MDAVTVFVGFDPRESAAYHVFCQSVLDTSSQLVQFIPLHKPMLENFDGQRDGTNAFIFSRYLVPHLMHYKGWAIFVDGDMVCVHDIANLWALRQDEYAVQVVKHDYRTRHPRKYIGTKLENDNVDYPRKNWSSVMIWNCGHPSNRLLNPEFVREASGSFLHRFEWLKDDEIGELPSGWNHLVGEYSHGPASLLHFTLGVPGIHHYRDVSGSWRWHSALVASLQCAGEIPSEMVNRSEERVGQ